MAGAYTKYQVLFVTLILLCLTIMAFPNNGRSSDAGGEPWINPDELKDDPRPGIDNTSVYERMASYIVSLEGNLTIANGTNAGMPTISSNDTAFVLQKAVDEVSKLGGCILIGVGDYYLNRSLYINGPISIVGSGTGYYNGTWTYGSALIFTHDGDGIVVNMVRAQYETGLMMRDLTLKGSKIATVGINMVEASRCTFNNLFIYDFVEYGVWLQEAHMNSFRDCRFMCNGNTPTTGGVMIGYHSPANVNNFWGCTFEFGASGVVITNSYSSLFDGCTFEGNGYHGVYGYSNKSLSDYAQHITIKNAYFELNNNARARGPICDIMVEGSDTSYWSIENVKTAGTMVNYSIMVQGWYTHLKNVRALERTVFWSSLHGSIEFVENLDEGCYPISSTVLRAGPNLVAEGSVLLPPCQTSILVNTSLRGKAMNIQITVESDIGTQYWVSENEMGQFRINICEGLSNTVRIYWRASL